MQAPIENIDFGLTANDYLKYRAGFPDSLFSELAKQGIGTDQQRILDIGTGTGTLARGFALNGNSLVGIDPAEEMLIAAAEIDKNYKVDIEYKVSSAEEIKLESNQFDIISAGQCWHWLDAEKATGEIKRLLKPEGTLVVCYYDWIPLKGNVVRRTEEIIESYNPDWKAGNLTGIHPAIFRDLGNAGFHSLSSFTYDEAAIYSHAAWRGRIRASAGVGASLNADEVKRFDIDLAAMLNEEFPDQPMDVPHRVFALIAKPSQFT